MEKKEGIKILNIISEKKVFKKCNLDDTLANLRRQYEQENFVFLNKDGNPINKEEENIILIKKILDENKIIKITQNKIKINFPDKDIKESDYFPNQQLDEFRKKNNITKQYIFTVEGAEVELKDEITYTIDDIMINGEIFLKVIGEEEKKKKKEEEEKKKKKEEEKKKKKEEEERKKKKEEEERKKKKEEEEKKKKKEEEAMKNKNEKKSNIIENAVFIQNIGKKELYLYDSKPFNKDEESQCYTILVLGQTGSGKTTLLNSFLNYLLKIKRNDKERYIIINENNSNNQSDSKTSDVNIYYIKSHNGFPPIKIIDTPGFGDNKGIEYDKNIIKKIGELFLKKISKINVICLVLQYYNIRLTLNQKYIFQSVINLFGKNVIENFLIMLTFSDGGKNQIIDSLLNDSSFSIIKNYFQEPWYLNFNNSAIFSDKNDQITDMYFQMGMKSFEKFLIKIKSLPSKSISISKDVFRIRERINIIIEYLIREIHSQIILINWYRYIKNKLNNINSFNFHTNYNLKINLLEKECENSESLMINCNSCYCSCQKIFQNNKLSDSLLFEKGKCILCNCNITEHSKEKKEIVYKTKEENINYYSKYKMIIQLKKDNYNLIKKSIFNSFIKFEEINKLNQQLQNVALLSGKGGYEDYIDMMIIHIEKDKNVGYIEEISILKQFKESLNDIFYKIKKENNYEFKNLVNLDLDNFINKIL